MGDARLNQENSPLCIGLLAHVDAGKTTLAESLLYQSGEIRRWGRVDHGNSFLDNHEMERARGITIFSKQARFSLGNRKITLLDTPGHVDFSAEMERTLQILDMAILVISGAEGVQSHVRTLWQLLNRYHIPVFLFINKMDQPGTDAKKLLQDLAEELDERCLDFSRIDDHFEEELAMGDEEALTHYLEQGSLDQEEIRRLVAQRKIFPCYFGSALKQEGIVSLLEGISLYAPQPQWGTSFGARVYKISRDVQGNRLTHLKVTGGRLDVKTMLTNRREDMPKEAVWEEKVDQIRLISGGLYTPVSFVTAGEVCAVTGLGKTAPGEGLGIEQENFLPILEPVLTYRLFFPEGTDFYPMYRKLMELEEEIPEMHLHWEEDSQEIHVQVMGDVQMEVLQQLIRTRYQTEVSFGQGSIVYRETIAEPVEGVGHFEPLRHYAEVHLLLEPLEQGRGMEFLSRCSEDELDKNWQRLILTHLEEKAHRGVLTGAEITDMRISLMSGRAHAKHTEGGDFRQATYRGVRQGLRRAKSILLEPMYDFCLEVPQDRLGRAMTDLNRMGGQFGPPQMKEKTAILTGKASVEAMRGYSAQVLSYTQGRGRLSCIPAGYEPCRDTESVLKEKNYNPDQDVDNPCGSVFCQHGAGFLVSWDQVEDYMHLKSILPETSVPPTTTQIAPAPSWRQERNLCSEERELEEIFTRTYGKGKDPLANRGKTSLLDSPCRETRRERVYSPKEPPPEEYLLVDGYNIIFSWPEFKELAAANLEGARRAIMDLLCNYQGFRGMTLIVVFDSYKV